MDEICVTGIGLLDWHVDLCITHTLHIPEIQMHTEVEETLEYVPNVYSKFTKQRD